MENSRECDYEQAREFARFINGLTAEQQAAAYLVTEGRVELARLQGKIKKQPQIYGCSESTS